MILTSNNYSVNTKSSTSYDISYPVANYQSVVTRTTLVKPVIVVGIVVVNSVDESIMLTVSPNIPATIVSSGLFLELHGKFAVTEIDVRFPVTLVSNREIDLSNKIVIGEIGVVIDIVSCTDISDIVKAENNNTSNDTVNNVIDLFNKIF